MCAGAGKLRGGWQCSLGMTAGQLYSQILTLRLTFSCFRDTSKGLIMRKGETLRGGDRDFL